MFFLAPDSWLSPAMVSLLQDQARIKFPSLDPLESNPRGNAMQACEETVSPAQQAHPGFHRQPRDGHGRADRSPPGSPRSSGASPPCPEQLFARFPAGQHLPRETAAYEVLPPAEPPRRSAYEDGGAAPCGRFPGGARRSPFHPYQRPGPAEPFPEARLALAGEAGQPFPAGAAQDAFDGFTAQLPHLGPDPAWSSGTPHSSLGQEPHLPPAQEAHARLKTAPLEEQPGPYCCQPHGPPGYCTSHPFHQYLASNALPLPFLSAPHHPYQRMGLPGPPQPPPPPLFPKPIYSYSILIFMALKNSKTGSLPVSEIYNFMTDHFPYFK
ncbi:hypothetical protein Chor_009744, partial [Crotalus horridus]